MHDPSNSKDKITADEAEDILAEITNTSQEEYRSKVLEMYGVPIHEGENAKRLMQKAYLVYSTISSI